MEYQEIYQELIDSKDDLEQLKTFAKMISDLQSSNKLKANKIEKLEKQVSLYKEAFNQSLEDKTSFNDNSLRKAYLLQVAQEKVFNE